MKTDQQKLHITKLKREEIQDVLRRIATLMEGSFDPAWQTYLGGRGKLPDLIQTEEEEVLDGLLGLEVSLTHLEEQINFLKCNKIIYKRFFKR